MREAARVLRPGGLLGVLLPAEGPLTVFDRVRYASLLGVLGVREPPFPHPRLGRELAGLLLTHGFELESDVRVRFRYRLDGPDAAAQFVESLYLPNATERRRRAGVGLASRWGGGELGVPFRRVVARRPD